MFKPQRTQRSQRKNSVGCLTISCQIMRFPDKITIVKGVSPRNFLRPHPTTAFAFASCSSPKFLCRTFGKCRPLCPAASTLPESCQQGDVGFTSTETLTTRKHLTRLYVGSSLALRPIPLSGKTPAHRSPFARLARTFGLSPRFARHP